jgi:HlyD family secretion protein
LIAQELEAMRRLLAQGFATVTRVNALERESHRLEAERGSLSAAISRERARIAQTQAQRFQLLSERQVSVAEDLKQTELQLSEARAQRAADSEAKRSLDIVAPVSGRIQQLAMRAGGGILSPGEAMAIVVPDRERLLIEVRIAPDKIDRLRPGQTVKVRFPAFQASTTPEFPARLLRISPTISRDEQTGLTYYAVACALDPSEHPALVRLRPGMPAEAHIATGSQPALLYFLKPLLDQISRTFREP